MSILLNGFVLGRSVAWPPGPVNAEMIRRGLPPRERGGGFWETWRVGLGACTGDFIWALAVAAGAGALLNKPGVRTVLGTISLVLLFVLTALFSRAAWKTACRANSLDVPGLAKQERGKGGYLLGLLFVLSSPWNIGFWLAVVGSQQTIMAAPSLLKFRCRNFRPAHVASRDSGADRSGNGLLRCQACLAALPVRSSKVQRSPETPEREKSLTVNEIYYSIQGESTWAGRPCVFVRLTFCDLRCNYCDTEYAFYEGKKQTLKEIVDTAAAFRCPLVEITGGEPLLQKNVLPLMSILADGGSTVLLETSGAHDISKVDPRVHRIMDLKTPGSGEVEKNFWPNIGHLTLRDEVKFVMGSREDYKWSCDKVRQYSLTSRCHAVLFSPIFGRIDPREIVEWILADRLDVRFQLQMHKFIWSPTQRGV